MRIFLTYISVFVSILTFNQVFCQLSNNNEKKLHQIFGIVNKYHYQPVQLSKKNKNDVIFEMINYVDPYHLHFINDDIVFLQNIDFQPNNIAKYFNQLISQTSVLYKVRLDESDSILTNLTDKQLLFLDTDTAYSSKIGEKSKRFYNNSKEKVVYLEKWCKIQTLQMYYFEFLFNDSLILDEKSAKIKMDSLFRIAIEKERCHINSLITHPSGFDDMVFTKCINAYLSFNDPHTSYFPPAIRKSFINSLSKESLSFGLYFTKDNNEDTRIAYIVPGSPAWKSNLINEGDKLLEIITSNDNYVLHCQTLEDIEQIVNFGEPEITLKIEKNNGKTETVKLLKEQIELEENKINTFILEGDKKIGYINLPSFYVGMDNTYNRGCVNDISKAILNLKKEKIEGLILDLRNNAGGYIMEAIDLVGIFIDIGPYCIYDEKNRQAQIIKDLHRGSVYDDNLIVLVNNYSASASELVAGALQDYNRSLIVGTKTFGKATMQIDIPLMDTSLLEKTNTSLPYMEDMASINMTIGKFYRVTGLSHQKIGVLPDIELEELFNVQPFNEASYTSSLENDTINKKIYHFNPFPEIPIARLKELHFERLQHDTIFSKLLALSDSLSNYLESKREVLIKPEPYFASLDNIYKPFIEAEKVLNFNNSVYSVKNPRVNKNFLKPNQTLTDINERIKENLTKDYHIIQTYQIMLDLIQIKKN